MSEQTTLKISEDKQLTTVDGYTFEPIKGYPMLRWKGKRPFTSTQFYPAQLKENHGEPVNGWMNRIYWGDNLQVMSHLLKEFRGKVDLVYIDPPFDSKANYKKKISLRGNNVQNDSTAFEEKQYTDLWNCDSDTGERNKTEFGRQGGTGGKDEMNQRIGSGSQQGPTARRDTRGLGLCECASPGWDRRLFRVLG